MAFFSGLFGKKRGDLSPTGKKLDALFDKIDQQTKLEKKGKADPGLEASIEAETRAVNNKTPWHKAENPASKAENADLIERGQMKAPTFEQRLQIRQLLKAKVPPPKEPTRRNSDAEYGVMPALSQPAKPSLEADGVQSSILRQSQESGKPRTEPEKGIEKQNKSLKFS
jgi:hypothetical protein